MKCYCSQHSPKEDNKCSKTLSFSDYNSNIMFKDNRISHKMQKANINSICQRTTAIDPLCTQFKENHIIEKSKTPNIWEFTACAIDKGAPNTLNYIPNKESVVYVRNMTNGEIVTKVQADTQQYSYPSYYLAYMRKKSSKHANRLLSSDTKTNRRPHPLYSGTQNE